ncbi:MAG: protoglobin domain-containing protein [Thermoanaerobaculia bacterium]
MTTSEPSSILGGRTVAEYLTLYDVSDDSLAHIRAFGEEVIPRMEELVDVFYQWLRELPEFETFLGDPETFRRARAAQVSYWQDFFRAEIDDDYVERRRQLGRMHVRIDLQLPVYLASVNRFLVIFATEACGGELTTEAAWAMTKLAHLDTAVVTEEFHTRTQQRIAEQSASLMQMSTPVTAIWDGILMLPVVGVIDSKRAQDVMNAILEAIDETHAKIVIMDISGVAVVDTAVANHLIKITKATKLMGCECTISGISPAIAQTIVELGVDVGTVTTTSELRAALAHAFRTTGAQL